MSCTMYIDMLYIQYEVLYILRVFLADLSGCICVEYTLHLSDMFVLHCINSGLLCMRAQVLVW